MDTRQQGSDCCAKPVPLLSPHARIDERPAPEEPMPDITSAFSKPQWNIIHTRMNPEPALLCEHQNRNLAFKTLGFADSNPLLAAGVALQPVAREFEYPSFLQV